MKAVKMNRVLLFCMMTPFVLSCTQLDPLTVPEVMRANESKSYFVKTVTYDQSKNKIYLIFSQKIDRQNLQDRAFIIQESGLSLWNKDYDLAIDVVDDIDTASFIKNLTLNTDETAELEACPSEDSTGHHKLIIPAGLPSLERYPLDQVALGSREHDFIYGFDCDVGHEIQEELSSDNSMGVGTSAESTQINSTDDEGHASHETTGSQEASDSIDTENPESHQSTASNEIDTIPEVPDSASSTSGSDVGQQEDAGLDVPSDATSETVDFVYRTGVHITEVVTDPLVDFGDSSGGDGIAFNKNVGSGSVSSNDEYIEIYNAKQESLNISQWCLIMEDGSNANVTLSDSNWETYFSNGGDINNFQADEVAVFGNPSGSMSDSIAITLFDENGTIQDTLTVTNGDASGVDEQAYQDDDGDGVWSMGVNSIGDFDNEN